MLPNIRLVIFDWDGTLVDSQDCIVECLSFVVSEMKLPARSRRQLTDVIGLGMVEVVRSLYPGLSCDEVSCFRDIYSKYFFSRPDMGCEFFGGALEFVARLRDRGVKVAIATGKSRRGLDRALSGLGGEVSGMFGYSRCADESKSKPDPQMLHDIVDYFQVPIGESVMIGDTRYDLEMAKKVGMKSVGVSFGCHSVLDLGVHNPVAIVDSYAQMCSLFGFSS